jgi:cupin superfamily acireductone dioxygenase involved in methionine salvage
MSETKHSVEFTQEQFDEIMSTVKPLGYLAGSIMSKGDELARMLEYEKEEIIYRDNVVNKVDDELTEILEESYHPHATARLRAYVAGDGYEGLMTADGHKVTMPLYWEIEALDHDLYLCSATNDDKVIINGKGEIVK